jgi:hypothetical protein
VNPAAIAYQYMPDPAGPFLFQTCNIIATEAIVLWMEVGIKCERDHVLLGGMKRYLITRRTAKKAKCDGR